MTKRKRAVLGVAVLVGAAACFGTPPARRAPGTDMVIPGGGGNVLPLALIQQCRPTLATRGDTSKVGTRGCFNERPNPADPAVVGRPSPTSP